MTRITEGRAREREREFPKNYGIRYIIVSSCLMLKTKSTMLLFVYRKVIFFLKSEFSKSEF
jgi:hypothetical protein